ncbi:acetyltransferase [Duganella sp. FT50W]|uniref:Acetyltransferase n=2 Tax=Duganella lactea TaxID=2692173 RepID=A0A6L8MJ44_9BURK|nr:acetyltransferase [Duganella lactea]
MTTTSPALIIIGASGFGLEVHFLAERLGRRVKGFLDDNANLAGATVLGAPVLGKIESWTAHPECEFVVAIGNPRIRRKVVAQMGALGTPAFATLIDPAALLDQRLVALGQGSIICAGAMFTTQITLGQHCIVNLNATIGHEATLGDFVTIAPLAAISGCVRLADLVEVGTSACVRQGVTMGPGSMLGMGGVLTKDAEANTLLIGNPARMLRQLPPL